MTDNTPDPTTNPTPETESQPAAIPEVSAPTPKAATVNQPKIVHRQALRTLILVIVLGALYLGYQKWRDISQDYSSVATANTVGWLCALEYQSDGQQAVAFDPKGQLTNSTGWKSGNTDRDITWQPNGNRIFFVSDREENNYHVFRWNPTDGSDPVKRTIGSRSRGFPEFPREKSEDADATALIVSGGFVLEYTPKDMSTRQVLPPLGREVTSSSEEEGGGSSSQFGGAYQALGTSFRIARWCKGKTWIAAIMERDNGELLVLQKMEPNSDGKFPHPVPIAAGEHIDFDVNPQDGTIVAAVQDFQWPVESEIPAQFIKGHTVTRPFSHWLIKVDPDASPTTSTIGASNADDHAFASPAISPDGSQILVCVGPYNHSSGMTPSSLVAAPIQSAGIRAGAALLQGEIYEPAWAPSGELITFAKKDPDGKRHIYTAHKDGSALTDLTGTKGNFGHPQFSPQKPAG